MTFFINEFDDGLRICDKIPIDDQIDDLPKLSSPKKDYPWYGYARSNTIKYVDNGTELHYFEGSNYRFPKKMDEYLTNFYGDWKVKLNKIDSYKDCNNRAKKLDGYIECYWSYKYA